MEKLPGVNDEIKIVVCWDTNEEDKIRVSWPNHEHEEQLLTLEEFEKFEKEHEGDNFTIIRVKYREQHPPGTIFLEWPEDECDISEDD